MTTLAFVTLVNRPEEFAACRRSLLGNDAEDGSVEWHEVRPNERGWNASRGLNEGIARTSAEWIVAVHQDVRFPPGWRDVLTEQLRLAGPETAVAGVAGVRPSGSFRGHVVDPNGHCWWPPAADEVLTLDECVIVLRRDARARFDEEVPGFHCYGAEICLRLAADGGRVRTIDAPVLHLSTGRLDSSYRAAAEYLVRKWGPAHGHVLPTTAAPNADPSRAGWARRLVGRVARRRSGARANRRCGGEACRRLEEELDAAGLRLRRPS